jgi:hypothetical protein
MGIFYSKIFNGNIEELLIQENKINIVTSNINNELLNYKDYLNNTGFIVVKADLKKLSSYLNTVHEKLYIDKLSTTEFANLPPDVRLFRPDNRSGHDGPYSITIMGLGGLCLGSLSGMYSVIKTGFFSNNSKYNFNDDLIAKIVIPSEMLSIDNTNQFKIIYLNIQKQLNNNILPKKIRDNIKKVLDKIVNEPDKNNRLEKIVNMYFCLSINIGIFIFIKKYGKQKTDIMTDVFNNIFDTFFEEKHINKIKTNQICTIEKPYYSEKFNLTASYFALGIVVILLFLFFAKRYKM